MIAIFPPSIHVVDMVTFLVSHFGRLLHYKFYPIYVIQLFDMEKKFQIIVMKMVQLSCINVEKGTKF